MAWLIYRIGMRLKEAGERLRLGMLIRAGLALRDRAMRGRAK